MLILIKTLPRTINRLQEYRPLALSEVEGGGHTILRIKDFDDFIHNFDQKAL